MHIPAQSQEHVRLNDVLLQLHPSLPGLRRKLPSLVRSVHRYYGAVRVLQHVHVRRTAMCLHGPAFADCRRRTGDLPVLVHVVSSACPGSNDYAGPDNHSRLTRLPCCLPPTRQGVGILIWRFSKLNHPAHRCLRPTLRNSPRDGFRKTRGQDGFATSFPVGLLHPLQHAGLARRTPYNARSALLPERVQKGWAQGNVADFPLIWIGFRIGDHASNASLSSHVANTSRLTSCGSGHHQD